MTTATDLRDIAPWVPSHIAPTLLRAADELEQMRSLALEHVDHFYDGLCPDALDRSRRDPGCPACRILGDA